ncbi:MAG: sulfatase, partial [Pirellulales bacterium]
MQHRLLWLVVLALIAQPSFAAPRNVVLIVADDLGLQLGCYGESTIKTPHIDALAAAGTRFRNAYCTTASCSPSRTVLLTGLYNHANGQYGLEHAAHHFRTKERIMSLPNLLARSGYRTLSIGKLHIGPESVYPFHSAANEGTQGSRNTVRMAENAKKLLAAADNRPFFLYFCPTDPHRSGPSGFANGPADRYPGVKPIIYDPASINVPKWLPDQPEVRGDWSEYYQSISRLDQGVGALVQAIKDSGHWDDTLIIFLSDNGPPFPGAKTTLYEPGMHLPLIVRHPGSKAGIAIDALVNWTDIAPTILDFAGRPDDARGMQGRSLLKILDEPKPPGWDTLYASHTFHEVTMYYPMRLIRQGDLKLILNLAHALPFPFASDL